jgi:IS30 family transposase
MRDRQVPRPPAIDDLTGTATDVTGDARTDAGRRSWSPEQIAHRGPTRFPDDPPMRISHEAIYQALFVQGRDALRRELTACLRSGRALRVPRARTRADAKGFITDSVARPGT